jgi:lysophospholipase L1-like esterase
MGIAIGSINRICISASIRKGLPIALKNKFLFLWTGNYSSGNLKNSLGSDVITITDKDFTTNIIPSTTTATFAVPDNATYLGADGTDDFWYNNSDVLQQKTFADLIASTTLRSFIKYSDFAPYYIYAIGILKEGEVLTEADKIALNKYFKLWAEYWGVLMDSGYMKDNRVGSEDGPDGAPSALTATVDSDTAITLDWTIGSTNHDGHRIYISTDGVTFTANSTVLGAVATKQVTGLTAGVLYYFYVVAYKGSQESTASNTVYTVVWITPTISLFTRMTAQPSYTEKVKINTAITDLVAGGRWDKLEVLQVYDSESEQASLLNWIADANNATKVGVPYFMAKRGFGGITTITPSAIDTGFAPSAATKYTQNSASVGLFIGSTGITVADTILGLSSDSELRWVYFNDRYSNTSQYYGINTQSIYSITTTPKSGIVTINRTAANAIQIYKENDATITGTIASTALATGNIYLLGYNKSGDLKQTHKGQIVAFYAGSSLTEDDHDNIASILHTLCDNSAITFTGNVCCLGDSTIANHNNQIAVSAGFRNTGYTYNIAVGGHTIVDQKTSWETFTPALKASFNYVFIEVGLNDLNPAETAADALVRYQALVDSVIAGATSAKIITCTMTPCKSRMIGTYGAVNGLVAYQKWLDMNEAIRGQGANAITGMDAYVDAHTTALDDGSGNLAAAYNLGDGIHENNAGRIIIADAWLTAK